ncbi:hypothetical protein BURKHO8Y_20015 [Burkholderia sp. 8Y]|nr:hypothetical protein BURKHO8Y_20015 [Burkholderia sp. 8Y]
MTEGQASVVAQRVLTRAMHQLNREQPKTVLTTNGELRLDIPRDRRDTFEPQLVGNYQRRPLCSDVHVISTYARGMRMCEIQDDLLDRTGQKCGLT